MAETIEGGAAAVRDGRDSAASTYADGMGAEAAHTESGNGAYAGTDVAELEPADAPESPRTREFPANAEAEGEAEGEPGDVDVQTPAVESSADAEGVASDPDAAGPGDTLTDAELAAAVSALVYASPDPLSERRLQTLLEGPRLERVREALATLGERLAQSGLPYELRALAGGYQILTTAEVGEFVQRLAKVRKSERISGAALETLAVVAYRQPVTKAEVEAIRGVQAGPILRTLIERGLVRVSGRADVPGHPLQYGTTREFLDRFGLASLSDLPRDGELAKD